MKKRLFTILSLFVIVTVLVTGCGTFGGGTDTQGTTAAPSETAAGGEQATEAQGGGDASQVLRLNNHEEPGALHPQLAQGTHDSWVLEHVFEGLTKKSIDGKVIPGMAKEWKISPDGLVYTFTLRDDIKWTNGDPVTASDFEYAWKFGLDPRNHSDYAYQLYYIKGGAALNSYAMTADDKATEETKKKDADEIQKLTDALGLKVVDEKTLEVTLEAPAPYFIELQSFYTYYPINKKVAEANPDWHKDASTYVSNGAFKLTDWKHKESMKIEKNADYYDKDKIKLAAIDFIMIQEETTEWQMYQNGELDQAYPIPGDVQAELAAKNDPEYIVGPDLATYFYRFNTSKKPFSNVKIRKALAMAIDRKIIVEQVAQGGQTPAFAYVPLGIPDVSGDFRENGGDYFKENVEEAKKLLAEGLKEEGLSKLSFTFIYNTSEAHKKIGEAIQEMWRKNLGVECKLENMDFQVKIDREHKLDYDVSRSGWIGDYIDPMTFMDMFTSWSTQNDTGWTNADYDKYIKEAQASLDEKVRMEAMHKAEQILLEAMPILPIYYYTHPYTLKPYVKDVYKPANRYPQFHYAYIQK